MMYCTESNTAQPALPVGRAAVAARPRVSASRSTAVSPVVRYDQIKVRLRTKSPPSQRRSARLAADGDLDPTDSVFGFLEDVAKGGAVFGRFGELMCMSTMEQGPEESIYTRVACEARECFWRLSAAFFPCGALWQKGAR